jgi:hypothetical protein
VGIAGLDPTLYALFCWKTLRRIFELLTFADAVARDVKKLLAWGFELWKARTGAADCLNAVLEIVEMVAVSRNGCRTENAMFNARCGYVQKR